MLSIFEDVRGGSMYWDRSSQRYRVRFLARVNGEGIKPVFKIWTDSTIPTSCQF